jgi:peptide/nickel transport system substrate-binding protein
MNHVAVVATSTLIAVSALSAFQAAAQQGKPLVFANKLATLDPHAALGASPMFLMANVYDGLYRYTDNPPKLVPWLAVSHTVSADGKTWTFKLRDHAKFHDGKPVTATDVVYSFQRAMALKVGAGATFVQVLKPENVVAVDPHTVRLTLNQSFGPFLSAIPTLRIVNSALLKQHDVNGDQGKAWLVTNDAGSGPYQVVAGTVKPSVGFDLKKFDGHFYGWSDNPQAPVNVAARDQGEMSTNAMALVGGTLDVTHHYLEAEDVERVESSKTGAYVRKEKSMRIGVIHMNNTKPPLNNVNFRKCLSHAFNYDDFIKSVLQGNGVRATVPMPDGLWGQPRGLAGYSYDMAKAKAFCDKAKADGAPVGQTLDFQPIATVGTTSLAAQLLQADLAKLGIKMTVTPQQWVNLTSLSVKPATAPDLWMTWHAGYYADPDNFVGQMYDSALHGSWRSSTFYRNPKVDELLREARGLIDQAKRQPLYEQALRLVVDDAPAIWTYTTIDMRGLSKRVSGYQYSAPTFGSELRWLKVAN